jgi:periplasmic divalent cation tolerance protein
MSHKIVVLTTAGNDEQALKIANELVNNKLAACVNIIPTIHSVYRWKDKIWNDTEKLLLIKTSSHLFQKVREKIKAIHTYELPEIISFKVEKGDENVLKWIDESILREGTLSKKKTKKKS